MKNIFSNEILAPKPIFRIDFSMKRWYPPGAFNRETISRTLTAYPFYIRKIPTNESVRNMPRPR